MTWGEVNLLVDAIDWLSENKEWVFSGIGVLIISLLLTLGRGFLRKLWFSLRNLWLQITSSKHKFEFLMVPLDQIANSDILENYHNPPVGQEIWLGGIPFFLKTKRAIFDSAAIRSGKNSVTLDLDEPVSRVYSVYLLVNAGGAHKEHEGKTLGRVQIIFDDGAFQETKLILGQNIREWAIGNPFDLVNNVVEPSSLPVWEGSNATGNKAVIDRLEIPVFQQNRQKRLKQILTFVDSGSASLAFLIFAITLEYVS